MIRELDAVYENGVLRPLEPLPFNEAQRVRITVSDSVASTDASLEGLIDHDLVAKVRAEVERLRYRPTIDEVREALSPIRGNGSDVVTGERGEY